MDAGSIAMLAVIVGLLFASALFSGTETAFTAASRAFVTRRAKEGDRRATTLARLGERKDMSSPPSWSATTWSTRRPPRWPRRC
jgi:hypothetical protein